MNKTRLEAFSDGVLAIVITIMVLEIKVPEESGLQSLTPLIPVVLSYVLSFLYIGIYWNNHHHMLPTLERVTGPILWANRQLLFWLTLIPFATGWLGRNHAGAAPAALYGIILLMAAVAYFILQSCIIASQGPNSLLSRCGGLHPGGSLAGAADLRTGGCDLAGDRPPHREGAPAGVTPHRPISRGLGQQQSVVRVAVRGGCWATARA